MLCQVTKSIFHVLWTSGGERYGPFHFHERDLVRSLIVFADPGDDTLNNQNMDVIAKNTVIALSFIILNIIVIITLLLVVFLIWI